LIDNPLPVDVPCGIGTGGIPANISTGILTSGSSRLLVGVGGVNNPPTIEFLTSGNTNNDNSYGFTTASISWSAGDLIVIDIEGNFYTPQRDPQSITASGLVFEKVAHRTENQYHRLVRYRAEAPSGGSGTIQVVYSTVSLTDILAWSVVRITGQALGNNGANAFVQTVGSTLTEGQNTHTVGLAALNSSNSGVLSSFAHFYWQTGGFATATPGTDSAEIVDIGVNDSWGSESLEIQWEIGEQNPSVTWNKNGYSGGIGGGGSGLASEIRATFTPDFGAVGSTTPSLTVDPSGVVNTGIVGSVNVAADANVTQGVVGVSSTGSLGNTIPLVTLDIVGLSSTGEVGNGYPTLTSSISGSSITGDVGGVGVYFDGSISGTALSRAVGNTYPFITLGLTGYAANGASGTMDIVPTSVGVPGLLFLFGSLLSAVSNDSSQGITGVSGAAAAGILGPVVTLSPSGTSTTGEVGNTSPQYTFVLSGDPSSINIGSVTPEILNTLVGTEVAGSAGTTGTTLTTDLVGYQLTGNVGSFFAGMNIEGVSGVEGSVVYARGYSARSFVVII